MASKKDDLQRDTAAAAEQVLRLAAERGHITQDQGFKSGDAVIKKILLKPNNTFRYLVNGPLSLVDAFDQPGC